MTMTKPDRAELRRLLAEADCCPLYVRDDDDGHDADCCQVLRDGEGSAVAYEVAPRDAALIAAAVNALPALLDAADRAEALEAAVPHWRNATEAFEAENARLRAEVERLRDERDDVCEFCQEKCKHRAAARKGGE